MAIILKIIQTVLLVLVQGVVLNHVSVMGFATPMPYIFALLTFRRDTGRKTLLIFGFLMGLVCDMFSNTPGVCAASCTTLAMMQPVFLSLFAPRDSADNLVPSYDTMGIGGFIRYTLFFTLLFQILYYLLAIFSFAHPTDVLINIFGGTAFTMILMLGMACFQRVKHEGF